MSQVIGTFLNFIDPLDLGFSPKGGSLWGLGGTGSIVPDKKNKSEPGNVAQPAAPSADAAAAAATEQQTASRRALLASGGETTLTGIGGAPLLGANVNKPEVTGV